MKFIYPFFSFFLLINLLQGQSDQDNDGMSDTWEIANGLNQNDPSDAFADPDQDQILNLQEYILNTDPAISDELSIFEYDTDQPITRVYQELRRTDLGLVIIRIPQGTYDFSYGEFWSNDHRVMLQGGWNDDFSDYDPCRYKTILTTEEDFVFGLIGVTNHAGVVIDGIEFILNGGFIAPLMLVSDAHDMDIHVHACSFHDSTQAGFNPTGRFSDQHVEITVSNSLFYNNPLAGMVVAGDAEATFDIRIINCTFNNPNAEWGGLTFNKMIPTNQVDLSVKNSIFTDNGPEGSLFMRSIFFNIHNITFDNSYAEPSSLRFNISETNPQTILPEFISRADGNYELVAGHPYIDRGIEVGLPFEGTAIDIGAVESEACECILDIFCEFTTETSENANDASGTVTIREGLPPYNIMWSNGETANKIENLMPGEYSVTVTDATGCEAYCSEQLNAVTDVDPSLDTDDDGIPDLWELANGMDLNDPEDAFCDSDYDQILNLFEYQLQTDPNDFDNPPKYQISPSMTETEIKAIMNLAVDTSIYMRFAEGQYDLSFDDADSGMRTAREGYKLMIQGGWDSNFLNYDPYNQPTILSPSGNNRSIIQLIGEPNNGVDSTALVVDGIQCEGGGRGNNGSFDLSIDEGVAFHSFYNCSFYEANTTISISTNFETEAHQFWLINSVFDRLSPLNGAVYGLNSDEASSRWRIMNSTFRNYGSESANAIYIEQNSPNAYQGLDITNSILWNKDLSPSSILFDRAIGIIDLSFDNCVYHGYDLSTGAPFFDVVEVNTFFDDPFINVSSAPYYMLRPDSPYRRRGIDIGLPFRDDKPDIGFNKGILEAPTDFTYIVTEALCGSQSGTITFLYNGPETVEYSIDGLEFTSDNEFTSLNNGMYSLYVRQNDCAIYLGEVEVEDIYEGCGKDTDEDGMEDEYELTHGFDPEDPTDALGDADCDMVLNLFEHMLLTDPHNPESPAKVRFTPNNTNQDYIDQIVKSNEEVVVIQMQEGEYDWEFYPREWANGPFIPGWDNTEDKRIMIQGGWNNDFTEYNPFCYRTKFMTEEYFLQLSLNYADSMVVILDGIEVSKADQGRRISSFNQWNLGGVVQYGINNCSFRNNRTAFNFRLDIEGGPCDFFVINTTIADNHHNFELTLPNGTVPLNYNFINCTVTKSFSTQKGLFELQKIGTDSLNLRIKNCIFWDEEHEHSTNIFPDKNIYLDVQHSLFRDGNANEYSAYTNTVVYDEDPQLELVGGHYVLPAGSRFLGAGIETGIPYNYSYGAPHIGVNANAIRIQELETHDTYCNDDDGWMMGDLCNNMGLEFSLDSVEWTNLPFFPNLNAGHYDFFVRATNCEAATSFPFEIKNNDSDLTATCQGLEADISVTVDGGVQPLEILWNDPTQSTLSSITVEEPGIYTVTVTDALACSVTCSYIYTDNCDIEVSCEATAVSELGVDDGMITTEFVGGIGNVAYLWDDLDNSTSPSLSGLAPGTYTLIVTDSLDCTASCSAEVIIPYVVDCSSDPCGRTLSVEIVSGGTPPYEINWTSPSGGTLAENSLTASMSGTAVTFTDAQLGEDYIFTVEDANGETLSCNTPIVLNGPPLNLDTVRLDPATCGLANGLIQLAVTNAQGTVLLSINNQMESSELVYENLAAGQYTFSVRDELGCQDTLELELFAVDPVIIIDSTIVQPSCGLDNGSISLQVNNEDQLAEVLMNGQTTTLGPNDDLSSGTYNFVITDTEGCIAETSIVLLPSLPVEIVGLDTSHTRCDLTNGSVSAQAEGMPSLFSIDGNNYVPNDTFVGLSSGPYLLYAKNDLCADTASFVINPSTKPELLIADYDDSSCGEQNGSVELTTISGNGPYQFEVDTTTNATGVFMTLAAGEYIAYVEDLDDCIDDEEFSIAESEGVKLSANVTEGLCGELGSLQLIATGGNGDYEFSEDNLSFSTLAQLDNLEGGEYVFYLRDSDNCFDTVKIQVDVFGVPELTAVTTPALCEEAVGSVVLTGTEGKGQLTFALENNSFSNTNTFTDLAPGSYTFIVQDEAGCKSTADYVIEATPAINLDLIVEQLFCGDRLRSLDLNPTGGTGTLSTSVFNALGMEVDFGSGLGEGEYTVNIVDELGCEVTELIVVKKDECTFYIPTAFNPNLSGEDKNFRIGVPAESNFIIQTFQIYDRWGNLVYNQKDIDPFTFTEWWDGTYKGRKVEQGVYVYNLVLEGEKQTIRGSVTIIR